MLLIAGYHDEISQAGWVSLSLRECCAQASLARGCGPQSPMERSLELIELGPSMASGIFKVPHVILIFYGLIANRCPDGILLITILAKYTQVL